MRRGRPLHPPAAPEVTLAPVGEDAYAEERLAMVENIIVTRDVIAPEGYRDEAYADHPLPIGYG